MRVFVTGASGGIGSAVVAQLIAADHQVVGLARSEASAATISGLGAEPLRGDIADFDVLQKAAYDADGIVYLAFSHDFSAVGDAVGDEARAVAALGDALVGSGKPLVLANGTPAAPGRASTEDDPFNVEGPVAGRGRTGQAVIDLAGRGVRSAVVRLPRSVHDASGRYGFASLLIQAARQRGVSGYVGDGSQRWPAVHRDDAASLFRLALEEAPPGSVLHAVGDEGDPMRAIAEVIGRRLGLPVESTPAENFGPLGTIFAVDQPSSSTLTQQRFGWRPTHPRLLEDLETGYYPE
ncbi:3-beta hydroxysteroid dehydrogenase [Mycobacterium florentinum]|uniref:3-beta hydroxysteroid dehydrogenase n=1 Tax=Mycobacterium florentinum TaxID=292462 RepID=A0A1X1U6Q1_MYCFL|nr:SDR family oxidoreductase [Mycobacterium florentinum]MCV7409829.1 SDR family oxidoreductase [Mycobacterium florentinum]ORV52514.1 3-beta hydroxysteroid dehydrogenase [Mycobacterium florentinum]BBX79129.1 3-beta hydroxysteroid dehydrogenase [Mycobacterium florentinum]